MGALEAAGLSAADPGVEEDREERPVGDRQRLEQRYLGGAEDVFRAAAAGAHLRNLDHRRALDAVIEERPLEELIVDRARDVPRPSGNQAELGVDVARSEVDEPLVGVPPQERGDGALVGVLGAGRFAVELEVVDPGLELVVGGGGGVTGVTHDGLSDEREQSRSNVLVAWELNPPVPCPGRLRGAGLFM